MPLNPAQQTALSTTEHTNGVNTRARTGCHDPRGLVTCLPGWRGVMAEQHIRVVCSEDGCSESDLYIYPNKTEARDARIRWAKNPYKCVRHLTPNTVLSAENPTRTHVLTVFEGPLETRRQEHVWRVSEDARLGAGYVRGPGFQAFAKDYPPGTRLTVIAHIELPGGES